MIVGTLRIPRHLAGSGWSVGPSRALRAVDDADHHDRADALEDRTWMRPSGLASLEIAHAGGVAGIEPPEEVRIAGRGDRRRDADPVEPQADRLGFQASAELRQGWCRGRVVGWHGRTLSRLRNNEEFRIPDSKFQTETSRLCMQPDLATIRNLESVIWT